jgi:hypothetical protein
MRVVSPAALGIGNCDLAQGFDCTLAGLGAGDFRIMSQHRLGDLVAHPHHGIERGHRFLKNHCHACAAQPLQFRGARLA